MDRARRAAGVVARRLINQLEDRIVDLGIAGGQRLGAAAFNYAAGRLGHVTASGWASLPKSTKMAYRRRMRRRKGYGSRYRRRKVYRRRRRYGRRNPRNLRGAMRATRIPRALKGTLMPRRLVVRVNHYYEDPGETGFPYLANGVTSDVPLDWMDFGAPLAAADTRAPQAFINLSKIYQKYLMCWVKLVVTFPAANTDRSTEALLYCSTNTYPTTTPFSDLMTVPGKRYYTAKPTNISGQYFVKWRQFLRPNRLLGVDWRMYAGDEDNWGTLGDGTPTSYGTPPTNVYPLHIYHRCMSTSNSAFYSGPRRWHWSAKVHVWSPDEDWVNGGLAAQALAALQAQPGVELALPSANEDEDAPTEVDEPGPTELLG